MTRRPSIALPDALVRDLWRMNPWWEGGALPKLPPTRRYLVDQIHRRLQLRLAPAVVVRGPRQIGKTTAQLQVVRDLLDQGVPPRNLTLPARSDQPEIDFVLTIGTNRIPLEVKYQTKLDPLQDTEGLRRFIEKAANNPPFGILVSQIDDNSVVDPRIVTLPLSSLMLLR